MPRQQLVAAMRDAGFADSTPLTGELVRELAVRSSVRAFLGGSVLPVAPGHYSIVLRAVDADSGRTLLTVTRGATDADLVQEAQTSAREVREAWASGARPSRPTARWCKSPRRRSPPTDVRRRQSTQHSGRPPRG